MTPPRLTPFVKWMLIACAAFFVVQQTSDQFLGGNLLEWLALVPAGFALQHRFWQLITYAFLHGDVVHLVLNMMMLVFIGSEIEALWGMRRFASFYFFCTTIAGGAYLMLQMFVLGPDALHLPMVGASGAIYGLLMAYGLLFGERSLLFMMLFPMKAKHFVWVLAGIEFFTTVFSGRGGLSGIAHLGGMLGGLVYLWAWARLRVSARPRGAEARTRRSWNPLSKKKSASHLKLVIDNDHKKGPKPPTFH